MLVAQSDGGRCPTRLRNQTKCNNVTVFTVGKVTSNLFLSILELTNKFSNEIPFFNQSRLFLTERYVRRGCIWYAFDNATDAGEVDGEKGFGTPCTTP